ncbi:MAG: hypothetical protein AB7I41_20125 [Candidatus Sericytochromatia bacterium]
MIKPPRLLCLGPTLPELRDYLPDLPSPWHFICMQEDPRLLPWQTDQTEVTGIAHLTWGGVAQRVDKQLFLFHLLQQIDWQAIWVTQPELAFLGVFAARLSGKPAFLQGPAIPQAADFYLAESQWLLENAQVIQANLETDSDFHRPFPIAPHLGIVYTKFVSETDI